MGSAVKEHASGRGREREETFGGGGGGEGPLLYIHTSFIAACVSIDLRSSFGEGGLGGGGGGLYCLSTTSNTS